MVETREQLCRLWLALAEGVTPRQRQRLLQHHGSYEALYERFPAGLDDCLSQRSIEELRKLKAFGLDRLMHRLEDLQIQVSFLGDSDNYPALLAAIPDPPDLLFYRGKLPEYQVPSIAIVGSRRETRYGRQHGYQIAKELAQAGVLVVSGLARGIDTAAHQGALAGQGPTAAVLGSGLCRLYPEENKALAEQILSSGGAVISELPPNTQPLAYHFPIRNRIVSGLCQGVLLVEAREKSGTLITVTHALEQGREVFALPGEVDSPGSHIPNRLIREGARLCTCAQDILDDMGWGQGPAQQAEQLAIDMASLSHGQQLVLAALSEDSKGFDELIEATGLDSGALSTELTLLELDGHVEALPGKQFRMIRAAAKESPV